MAAIKEGQVIWVKYQDYPYWPAMRWPEKYATEIALQDKPNGNTIHVRFFDSLSSVGWVTRDRIREWNCPLHKKYASRGGRDLRNAVKDAEFHLSEKLTPDDLVGEASEDEESANEEDEDEEENEDEQESDNDEKQEEPEEEVEDSKKGKKKVREEKNQDSKKKLKRKVSTDENSKPKKKQKVDRRKANIKPMDVGSKNDSASKSKKGQRRPSDDSKSKKRHTEKKENP